MVWIESSTDGARARAFVEVRVGSMDAIFEDAQYRGEASDRRMFE